MSHIAPVGPQNSLYTMKPATHKLMIHPIMLNITNAKAVLSFSCIRSFLPDISAARDLTEKITALTAQHKANGLKQMEDIKHIITPIVKCRSPGLEGIAGDSGRGWRTSMITLFCYLPTCL